MKWEYHILEITKLKLPKFDCNGRQNELVKHINELGQQGWEYCGPIDHDRAILFKRPAQ